MSSNKSLIKIGILGATGTVGQRFIQLLEDHPMFVIEALGASSRSAGKRYEDASALSWKQTTSIPSRVADLVVLECKPELFKECKVIFSGLDADVAGEIELDFLKAGFAVFTNAKNFRMHPNVPLIVPTVNADHLDLIRSQASAFNLETGNKGFIVANANCSTTGLVIPLKALQDKFGPLSKIVVTTMQAISGGGYPGVPSLDILGNVVPYISGEEHKIETEVEKILGEYSDAKIVNLKETKVSASCNRVPVIDGHTESVFVEFKNKPSPSPKDIIECLQSYRCEANKLNAPSAPENPIVYLKQDNRPQPRMDIDVGKGYTVTVGRVRECNIFDIKFTVLSHNTIMGAAGSSILNAEIAVKKGLII